MQKIAYKQFLVLGSVCALSLGLLKHNTTFEKPVLMLEVPAEIDYFSVKYTKIQMSELGVPKQKVEADYVEHDGEHEETHFTLPKVTFYQTDSPPWIVRAEQGRIFGQSNRIFLQDKVYMQRVKSFDNQQITIESSNVTIEPDKYYMETSEWAQLTTKHEVISGMGMTFFYQAPLYIELLSEVRGRREIL